MNKAKYTARSDKLPDNLYFGLWGGSIIRLPTSEGDGLYEFEASVGVKGINIPVWLTISGENIAFEETKWSKGSTFLNF
jgi:hypothetical protein